jgi:hypothetical protein
MFISTTITYFAFAHFLRILLSGRPEGLKLDHPDAHPNGPPVLHDMERGSGSGAVGDKDGFRVVEVVFLDPRDVVHPVLDLVDQVMEELVGHVWILGGESPHIVEEAGHVVPMHAPKSDMGRRPSSRGSRVVIRSLRHRGDQPLH